MSSIAGMNEHTRSPGSNVHILIQAGSLYGEQTESLLS